MNKSLGNYHVPPNHDLEPFLVLIWIPLIWTPTCKYLRDPKVRFPIWCIRSGSVLLFLPRNVSSRIYLRANRKKNDSSNDRSEPQSFPWLESL